MIEENEAQPKSLLALLNRCFVDYQAPELIVLSGIAYLTHVVLEIPSKNGFGVETKYITGPIKMYSIQGSIYKKNNKPFAFVHVILGPNKQYEGTLLKGDVSVGSVNLINKKQFKALGLMDQFRKVIAHMRETE